MNRVEPIVYRLNGMDELAFVNDAWVREAAAFENSRLTQSEILGRPIYAFISDAASRELYREILGAVRRGKHVEFQYRCDTPVARRVMNMSIAAVADDGDVEFTTTLISAEPRPYQELLGALGGSGGVLIDMCGWCKKVLVSPDRWVEVEDAVKELGLFDGTYVPEISHGMCTDCQGPWLEEIRREIALR